MRAMITVTAVRSPARVQSAAQKLPSPSALRDVRTALERHHRFSLRDAVQHINAFFLCTGILLLAQLFLVRAAAEQAALSALINNHTLPVVIQESALSSQRQVFLQALLRLPQVESANFLTKEHLFEKERQLRPELFAGVAPSAFTDRMEIQLRSPQDFTALFAFLQRPELSSVVAPNFLWELPSAQENLAKAVGAHRFSLRSYIWLMAGCFLLLPIALGLSMRTRMQGMRKQIQTLLLLGTDLRRVRRPFLLESAALILVCLTASIFLTSFFTPLISRGSLLLIFYASPWILLAEVCACLAFSTFAVVTVPLDSRSPAS